MILWKLYNNNKFNFEKNVCVLKKFNLELKIK